MAVINASLSFIFIHVPKCGGTSVCKVLAPLCTITDIEIGGTSFGEEIQAAYRRRHHISKHSTAMELRAILGHERWIRYNSFAVVRDPMERLRSSYFFLREWNAPQNYLSAALHQFPSFSHFLDSGLWERDAGPDQIFSPQVRWVANADRTVLLVDQICHVESLDTELPLLLSNLGVKSSLIPRSIPRLNTTNQSNPEEQVSSAQKDRIAAYYHRDYALLGYE